jgi:hypothetical protein
MIRFLSRKNYCVQDSDFTGSRRVGGFPAHAVIVIGSDIAHDDLAANYHRVGGTAAHPTSHPIRIK